MNATTHVACTQCGKQYQAPLSLAGKQIRCKACGAIFPIPSGQADDWEVMDASMVADDDSRLPGTPPKSPEPAQASSSTGSPSPYGGAAYGSAAKLTASGGAGQPGRGGSRSQTRSDEIDYEIFGDEAQYCVITLDPGEQVIAEAGAMMFMTDGIQMDSVFGDPSQQQGGFWNKALSAGKRALTGESLFMTTFTNYGRARGKVGFGSPYPGRMIPMHLQDVGGEIICQKDAFLCGARGIQVGIAFQKRIGVGLFGGEGFVMQRLTGDGIAITHAGGTMMFQELKAGEKLRIDTGCLMAVGPSVHYDVEFVGGLKNTFFGGEGLFLATLVGPGPIWLQSLPFSRLAGRMAAQAPGGGGRAQGEGSLLRGFGDMLMGDNG